MKNAGTNHPCSALFRQQRLGPATNRLSKSGEIMSSVKGKTSKKPSGPYWYWTELGPHNINLTDATADLPPGNYELFWDFRGASGEALEFSISLATGQVLVKTTDDIPSGSVDGWGSKPFTVP